ncbi:MAG: hypothetical protein LIP09_15560 [Bacteroidales bacterium]|nr:hypothetical protein [Bacteroidales bacterium]
MKKMRNFTLHDNGCFDLSKLQCGEGPFNDEDLENLRLISNVDLNHIQLEGNSNLLVFPQSLGEYGDKLGDQIIFKLFHQQLQTGNLMGFVGVNDTSIAILSRFAKKGSDFFLHYMLTKIFALNVFNLSHSFDNETIFDFLLYLFPWHLSEALSQGLFKTYRRFEYNDSRLRGPINVARHIKENNPFVGKVAYNTREHTFDNPVTQLVRHTIEYIKDHPFGNNILNGSQEIRNAVQSIIYSTPSYNNTDRQSVINENLKPVIHPFFTEYYDLQRLCLQILNQEGLKYGSQKDKVFGVLFDGAWLWEEYLNTLLSPMGFKHPRNKTGEGRISLFQHGGYPRYPDFMKGNCIIDAKYKRLKDSGIDRDDLHQIISYMYVEKATQGMVVYPSNIKTEKEIIGILRGYGGEFSKLGLLIPLANDITDFIQKINLEEKLLTYHIED